MSSKIDYGTVTVRLGEKEYVLKPTLNAIRKIDDHFGSLRHAVQSVSSLHFSGISYIIAVGASLSERGTKAMEEELFNTGVVNVTGPVAEYVGKLMSPMGNDEEEEGDEGYDEEGKA